MVKTLKTYRGYPATSPATLSCEVGHTIFISPQKNTAHFRVHVEEFANDTSTGTYLFCNEEQLGVPNHGVKSLYREEAFQ